MGMAEVVSEVEFSFFNIGFSGFGDVFDVHGVS